MLLPKTDQEARNLLGRTCTVSITSYNSESYQGRLVLWAPQPQQWLIYSPERAKCSIGHSGHVPGHSVGVPIEDAFGHQWCGYNCVTLAKQYVIRGNELVLEDN